MPHNFHQDMDFGASGFDAVHHGTLSIRSLRHDAEARGSFLHAKPSMQHCPDLQNLDFTVAYAKVLGRLEGVGSVLFHRCSLGCNHQPQHI